VLTPAPMILFSSRLLMPIGAAGNLHLADHALHLVLHHRQHLQHLWDLSLLQNCGWGLRQLRSRS
jgi:hypothetical protein